MTPFFSGSGQLGGFSPKDLRSAYAVTPIESAGRTIAIVDAYDDPLAESDLAKYRSEYGLGECTTANGCFRKVNQTGGTTPPAANAEWAIEISLDLDMASAMCPTCHLLLVEANTNSITDLALATNKAAQLGATVISNSYGSPETGSSGGYTPYYYHPGAPTFAASGDNGYRNYLNGKTAPSSPSTLYSVISVGGTSLGLSGAPRGWAEAVWARSGGGCSLQPKPAFQTDAGCAKKMTNDIAAVASAETPVSIYDSYFQPGWMLTGGTSASSPLVAGIMAQASPYTRSLQGAEAFYTSGVTAFDVTSGSNYSTACSPAYLCAAGAGYDGPSGMGTPNGIPHATPAVGGSWGPVAAQSPSDAGFPSEFYGVSCVSATACTASGAYVNVSPGVYGAMADSWDGGTWRSQNVIVNPGPKNGGLNGVSCTSATNCIAVGHYGDSGGVGHSLIEQQSGSSWSKMASVDPPGGTATQLNAVSCPSASACTAVGSYALKSIGGAMGEEWNGSSWSLVPVIENPGDRNGMLKSVSCTSATWCMAVGKYGKSGAGLPLAEERSGTTWTVRSVPLVNMVNQLNGVSCTSPSFCMAAGFYTTYVKEWINEEWSNVSTTVPMVDRWNGSTWTSEPFSPPEKAEAGEFNAVSCISSTACYAVGYQTVSKHPRVLIEFWNGSGWSKKVAPEPALSSDGKLFGVSCSSVSECSAVGYYGDSFSHPAPLGLTLFGS